MSPGRWLALALLAALLGAAYAQLFNGAVGVVAGLLMVAIVLGVRYATLRKAMRRAAYRGAVMATGYDADGRFVVTTGQGASGLDRGSVSAWTRSGAVVVLRLRLRPMRLLLPAELVDAADLAFLTDASGDVESTTGPSPAPTATGPTAESNSPEAEPAMPGHEIASPAALMPFHLTLTPHDLASVSRTAVRLWLTRWQTWLVFGLDGLGLVAGLLLRSWLLVVVAVLAAALCARAPWSMRRALGQVYPVGGEVRSGLTDDALLLQTVVSTEKVLRSTVVGVVAWRDGTVVELLGRRRVILPARLLPAEAVAQLAATTRR